MKCIVCNNSESIFFKNVDGVDYYECVVCDSIFADPHFINDVYLVSNTYNDEYWASECAAARERSFGSSLNRVAEVFLYAREKIHRFIDIGTGPGYLLDALSILMPRYSEIFYGVELYPPPENLRSQHTNYCVGGLEDESLKFDAGCCIEVIEHLAPNTLEDLIIWMASISNPGALYYFNSAQPSYVRNCDPGYLDPHVRGHICSYSLSALSKIFSKHGFTLITLPGRDWAFLVEFGAQDDASTNVDTLMNRVWNPVAGNADMLKENGFGTLMHTCGIESARCYYEAHMSEIRAKWAQSLNKQLSGG